MQTPNFYAEDGSVFAKSILLHGFWHSMGTTFNGYYIWGIYMLHELACVVNSVIYNGSFLTLPKSIALTSYGFLGFGAALPILLFKKYLSPITLLFIVLLSLFVPLTGSDYTIIGTIGTMKFCFVYIAFLLLVYRHLLPDNSRQFYVVDASLIICAYTNTTVYFLLPFALLRYLPSIRKREFTTLLRTRSLQSLFVVGIALLPQLYVIHRDGLPALPGYLDNPFNFHRTIEIVSRSYTYAILFPINKHLNDVWAILALLASSATGFFVPKNQRAIFIFGYTSIFLASFLFIANRTGVSDYFFGYKSGGPDQFFFTQNWIFTFIFSLSLVALIGRVANRTYRRGLYTVLVILIFWVLAPQAGTYGRNDFEERTIGNVYQNAHAACSKPGKTVTLTVYPTTAQQITGLPRHVLCIPAVLRYQPPVVDLGLQPAGNNYVDALGSRNNFTQTFVSPRDNLNGLNIYFSTFARSVKSPYVFTLYTGSCDKQLYSRSLAVGHIKDNLFYLVNFPAIKDSAQKTYCFTIKSAKAAAQSPLAVQLSQPNEYTAGVATLNGKTLNKDIVFSLSYEEQL